MRRVVPDRWAALRLLVAPSSYLLVIALVATLAMKAAVIRSLDGVDLWPLHWLVASMEDIACFLGLAALLAVAERSSAWMQLVTVPLAFVVAAIALVNAGYLSVAGEQLTWPTISIGLARFEDLQGIATETLELPAIVVVVTVLVLWFPSLLAHLALRRRGLDRARAAMARAHVAALLAAIGLVLALVLPAAPTYALRRLHGNAVARSWYGMIRGAEWTGNATFAGYQPKELVAPGAVPARKNVVLIVLESTRYDALVHAPNVRALAARGVEVTHARAVVPHTSKSLRSMLCGRLPIMQAQLVELSDIAALQCLPHVLDEAGWRTAFFQSAVGTFEDRPRLVHRLGFREFAAAEDIGGERLAYVASDDESLDAPFARWLDAQEGPFFATLLTSATHHPYILPARLPAADSDRERYGRLVEAADRMVGRVVEAIAKRGLADSTIVIVVGDHGEGFGDKGARQHATNFYEEGLRVPWVMVGPGLAPRRIDADASLLDVAPTVLALLGVATNVPPAHDVLTAPPGRALPFGCWYDASCRGFVQDRKKVVFIPETGQSFYFDLARDPSERDPQPFTEAIAKTFAAIDTLIDAHRIRSWPDGRTDVTTFPRWRCAAKQPCRHAP
jgi:hypothetical protein